MKRQLLALFSISALAPTLWAQPPAAPGQAAPPAATAPANPARIKALEKQLDAARREIETITADLRKTDERIEAKITKAVDTLKSLTDSKDSGTRVAEAKADVIDFLRKQITDYSQRRAQVRGLLDNRASLIQPAILEADLAKIDARLDRRIAQVIALGGSFARHQDYDKYDATGTGWYGHTDYRINEDWKANRRATLKAAQEKGKLGDAIDDSIRRLKSSASFKQSQLKSASPASARLLQADIARNMALIDSLENSRETLLLPSPGSQTPLGALEAKSIAERLKKGAAEVRNEQAKLTGYYNSLNAARARQAPILKALNSLPPPN